MTINVAVVTSEALVLGCDSIASTTRPLLDPFSLESEPSENGKFKLEFGFDDLMPHVSGAWGNVTKMFPLQSTENGACVAAVTCGLARLNERTMSSLAAEFFQKQHKRPRVNVEAIANNFFDFISGEYKKNYKRRSDA